MRLTAREEEDLIGMLFADAERWEMAFPFSATARLLRRVVTALEHHERLQGPAPHWWHRLGWWHA